MNSFVKFEVYTIHIIIKQNVLMFHLFIFLAKMNQLLTMTNNDYMALR